TRRGVKTLRCSAGSGFVETFPRRISLRRISVGRTLRLSSERSEAKTEGSSAMTRGACLCGSVRYEFVEPLAAIVHCHCSMCRKHHGASFATWAVGPAGALRWLAGGGDVRSEESRAGREGGER